MPSHDVVAAHADAIEAELRRVGLWSDEPPPPEAFQFKAAFANDTMAPPQWLQWVFLPNVRALVASGGEFPTSSSVGVWFAREYDSADTDTLLGLLLDFDDLFNPPDR